MYNIALPVRALIFAFLVGCAALGSFGAEPSPVIPVGAAQRDITPDYPVRLSGFGFRRTESEGVTQRIWAKALAFADEKQGPAILITADNLCVPDDITAEIARRLGPKTGLKRERLAITATHTHTAPMLTGVIPTLFGMPIPPEHQKNIDRYTKEFIDALEQVALDAVQSIAPSRLSWAKGAAKFAVNRRTKGGPVDHDLPMLAVHDTEGKLRAVYFSYACHCVTLSDNKISGDWAGFAQGKIQELLPGVVALASVGCGADSNPSSRATAEKPDAYAEQGTEIAREVQRLLGELKPIGSSPETRYARLDLALAEGRSRAEWEARAKQQDAAGYHARVNLERLDRGEALPQKINYPIQTWLFGEDLAIVFLPGETVVDFSLRLKREFDRNKLWVNGYSNDGRCYIPSERILKEGGYEGGDAMIYYDFPQRFAPGLEQKIIDTVAAQLPEPFVAPKGTEGTRPLSPKEALRSFRTKPGLRVELVAAEPLVQDPVAIDWGADGRLWVCEMNDYPSGLDMNWQPGGRVKFLTDENGDGQYERATVFLEGLPFPTGITAWGRGVFICAAPDIIYAEDTNGDGKADKVEKLFTGFFTDNFQARINSLSIGLDNWIYGANGLLGGMIQPVKNSLWPAASEPVDIRGRDIRIHPFSGKLETVSGLTQQGRARDDWGNWFGCDNSRLLLHFPYSEKYLRRNPHVAGPNAIRELTARPEGNRLFPSSPLLERFNDPFHANRVTSACGVGIYRDDWLGREFYGNAFICEPVHNLVHREIVEPGPALASRRPADETDSEFLSSSDNWFRPAQARCGPDGALYIVDMYRFLIEHPRWIPAARLAQIDIRAGADRGRIYRVVSDKKAPRRIRNLTKLKGSDLAAALDSPNGTERDRVQIELLLRQDKRAVRKLRQIANAAALPQVRLQALAALEGLAALEPEQTRGALRDKDAGVREHALRCAEPVLAEGGRAGEAMLKAVLPMAFDSAPRVVRQLAFTLGESDSPEAARVLGELARAWMTNAEIRTAIISSARAHCSELLKSVLETERTSPGRADWIPPLIATAAQSQDAKVVLLAIRASLPRAETAPDEAQMTALAALLDAASQGETKIAQLLDRPIQERVADVTAVAARIAENSGAPEQRRRAAIKLVGASRSEDYLPLLCRIAAEPAAELRQTAIGSLRKRRAASVADAILQNWSATAPSARPELVSLLLERDEWAGALLDAVRQGVVQRHDFSLADRQRLVAHHNSTVRKAAVELLAIETPTGRAEVLEKYKSALSLAGAAEKGAEVFQKNCSACHALNGIGQNVGPDLAPIRARDADYWMKNILDPNAVVEPRFVNYNLELKDGRSISGVIKSENANSVALVSATGLAETILRSEIAELRASSLSLMPEGLEQGIGPQAMADLLAFARSAPQPPPQSTSDEEVLRNPPAVARFILDASKSDAARTAAVQSNPQFAAALIQEMTRDLTPGTPEEYVRIPWIWRVAIAAGKRNDASQLAAVIAASVPAAGEPLRDWQAVVLGGGVINGLSQRNLWPAERISEVLRGHAELQARWERALDLAAEMADNQKIPDGTRYDALRMIALQGWAKRGAQLTRHLAKGVSAELQMGAVSGLADIDDAQADDALLNALLYLEGHNRELALDAFMRNSRRHRLLAEAVLKKQVSVDEANKRMNGP